MATKGLTDDGVQNTSSSESSATSLHETEEKPTVAEIYPFDSMVDAQLLFNSMKGLGGLLPLNFCVHVLSGLS